MKFQIRLAGEDGVSHETVAVGIGVTQALLAAKRTANWPAERRIIAIEIRRLAETAPPASEERVGELMLL